MKISPHFMLDEVTWSDTAKCRVAPDEIQIEMHRMLAEIVEVLYREPLGSQVFVDSGQRNLKIYKALLAAGYGCSPRSDHFFGTEINGWRWTCGAWDISFGQYAAQTEALYTAAVQWIQSSTELRRKVGQMILYPEKKFIHIANSLEAIYGERIAAAIRKLHPRQDFLVCRNGKYEPYV